ncbi:MAG: AbrB/MazE/SpoVT family DNA-binding domain-containing protein [Clostridioides sp.]|nr:AbrB/MazE/SpoVT family DNA-binding domain-containing protein [Clostridioides sp.]
MKATGIVRRIDDLGRVVVPKEIRKTLRIKEGDPLEIFTARDGEVILKKYSPMGELNEFAQTYAESLSEVFSYGVIITDSDSVIAVSKLSKKDYKDKNISADLEDIISKRSTKYFEGDDVVTICRDDAKDYFAQYVVPVISDSGDCIGLIMLISKDNDGALVNEEKSLKVAAHFLGKQVQ